MADVLTADPPRSPDSSRLPDILRRTVPWARLMSVMLFISSGLIIACGLVFGLGMAVGMAGLAGRQGSEGAPALAAAPAMIGGLFYAAMGLVNLFPAVFLWRFASRAKAYAVAATPQLLEQALDAQRSYWKFMGIFMIVAIGLGLVVGVIAAIAAVMVMRAAGG